MSGDKRGMKNLTMKEALKAHWPEYVMEAAELGAFMVSVCVFTAIIWHPASPIRQSIQNPLLRRVLTGIAMALTAICIIYSPWGKRSGAHFNPSGYPDVLSLGEDRALGRALLRARPVYGRPTRRACGRTTVRRHH